MHNWPCKGNESKSTCSERSGRLGWLPAPSPLSSITWSWSVGGGGLGGLGPAWEFWVGKGGCSGKSTVFSGLEWRLILTEENRIFIPRSKGASQFGNSFRWFNLADQFRGSIWQVYLAGKFGRFIQLVFGKGKAKQYKRKESMYYSVDL